MTRHGSNRVIPLVYSCSGCSNVAQLCNAVAIEMDRRGIARMSCISGVGGGVPSLVRQARSGLPVLALDGCELSCAAACLKRAGVEPDEHLVLTGFGLRKRRGCDAAEDDAAAARLLAEAALSRLSGMSCGHRASLSSPVCYQELDE
ncbi:putative zinc-binding protein [Laribacter hongkongensis]|uniref:putative zinc-binding protein n=1 Tax=Laribacter hongkongensis TaxID=168471 RepID=UPI0023D8FBFE|nr:putative zinc-binding protein [Laribacter hongkongensis]